MEREVVTERLKKIVKPYIPAGKNLDDISDTTDLIKDLEINSINLIDVVLDCETEFKIVIDNESMEKMNTVGSAIDIILNKTQKLTGA